MKPVVLLLGTAAVAILLVGCGGGESTGSQEGHPARAEVAASEGPPPYKCPTRDDRVNVTLDGHAGPGDVGILMADRRGFFKDAGLHIWVLSPANPEYPVPYVAGGGDDFGVAQQPQVVIGRDEGAQLVAFGALIAQPTESIIWLKGSGIHEVADLKGKTIAFPGVPFQRTFLEKALSRAGLTLDDVKVRRVGYELIPTLLSGKADAIFGGSWNLEGAALEARGERPVITKLTDLGIPGYDQSVVMAPYECIYKHPGMIRDFMDAVARGTEVAVENPGAAARVIEEDVESDPDVGRRELEAQLKATLPLLSRSGTLNPGRQALLEWMSEEGWLKEEWSFAVIFTNNYL
jgi:ABC-type nitrate/sulfonate/bicarbonate transport system substrate-binding protein